MAKAGFPTPFDGVGDAYTGGGLAPRHGLFRDLQAWHGICEAARKNLPGTRMRTHFFVGRTPTSRLEIPRLAFALLIACGAVQGGKANAAVMVSGGNCGTGTLATTGTTLSQLIIGCVSTGTL